MENHTFIIPAYRESIYLEACIQSLYNQTVKSKIIITTSTPNGYTKSIAEKYDIPYIVNDTDNTNVANNWNFALSKATTQLVTLAHQDDIYEDNYGETIIKTFCKYGKKNIQIAFTNYTDLVNDTVRRFSVSAVVKSSLLIPFFFSPTIKRHFFKRLILLFGNPICCPSVTFNKEVIGNFSFSAEHNSVLDWHAWYMLAGRPGSFLYIDKKLIKRRLHLQSGTSALLNDGVTTRDELNMFKFMWGSKRFAKVLSSFYAAGHKDNLIE